MEPVTVIQLHTDVRLTYQGISARQAIIAAYAQSRGDWNTWDYEKYAHLVRANANGYRLGDFFAQHDNRWTGG
jgi:hypothetical protein